MAARGHEDLGTICAPRRKSKGVGETGEVLGRWEQPSQGVISRKAPQRVASASYRRALWSWSQLRGLSVTGQGPGFGVSTPTQLSSLKMWARCWCELLKSCRGSCWRGGRGQQQGSQGRQRDGKQRSTGSAAGADGFTGRWQKAAK